MDEHIFEVTRTLNFATQIIAMLYKPYLGMFEEH